MDAPIWGGLILKGKLFKAEAHERVRVLQFEALYAERCGKLSHLISGYISKYFKQDDLPIN